MMLFRTTCTRTEGYLTTCIRHLRFSTPEKPREVKKKLEFNWTLVPRDVKLYKRKVPKGRMAQIQISTDAKLRTMLLEKKEAPPTEQVVKMVHDMFTSHKFISRRVMSYLSLYFGRKGDLMKCVEVQELTKQLQLQSRGHHDDLSLNGLLTAAQNCTDKELAVKHLKEYLRIIKGGVIPSSAMNKETLLRAMVKHGMTDEVLDYMSWMLARHPDKVESNFSRDTPSVYLSVLVQMSAEKEGADKATDLLREMCGRIPTQGMGSDSYALLGTLLFMADSPPYTKLLQDFLGVKELVKTPLYHSYSTMNMDLCLLYETLITVAKSRHAKKPFMMVGGPEGLWHKLIMVNEADHKAHINYIVALCKSHGIPLDQAFMRHIVLQFLNHQGPNAEWLDYSAFLQWYNATSAHSIDTPIWKSVIRHTRQGQLPLVQQDVTRAGAQGLSKAFTTRKDLEKRRRHEDKKSEQHELKQKGVLEEQERLREVDWAKYVSD